MNDKQLNEEEALYDELLKKQQAMKTLLNSEIK